MYIENQSIEKLKNKIYYLISKKKIKDIKFQYDVQLTHKLDWSF